MKKTIVTKKHFTCTVCNISFQRADDLKRHTATNRHKTQEQNRHKTEDHHFKCTKCTKVFKYKRGLVQHEKTHTDEKIVCPVCQVTFTHEHNLNRHIKNKHPETRKRKVEEEVAEKCHKKKRRPKNKVDGIIDESEICPIEIQNNDDDDDDEPGLVNVQRENWTAIKTHSRHGKSQKFVNVRWTQDTAPNFSEILRPVFEQAETRFKIQVSNGFILRKTTDDDDDDDDDEEEEEKFRYFHACENNAALFDDPQVINNDNDFEKFMNDLSEKDHLEHARQERPNTKYSVEKITNTSFYIYPMADFPMGSGDTPLPAYFSKCRGLHTLRNDKNGKPYTDQKCFFRCLALFQGAKINKLAEKTQILLRKYMKEARKVRFEGVRISDLEECEKIFGVGVEVYEFEERENEEPVLVCRRRSTVKTLKKLQLLSYEQHFCYISNVDKLGHAFACPKCKKLWKKKWMFIRHEKTCNGTGQRNTYTGGVYIPPPSPLETLQSNGLDVDPEDTFLYRATFDFETYFEKENLPITKSKDSKTVYTARHVPLSVSVSSNVPGYDSPKFFVNSENDPQHLVDQFVEYLEEISLTSFALMKERYASVYEAIAEKEADEKLNDDKKHGLSASSLKEILDSYLQELPVLGFNSSRYDLVVIKKYLFKKLCAEKTNVSEKDDDDDDDDDVGEPVREPESEPVSVEDAVGEDEKWITHRGIKFIVKNNNQYKCIVTPTLKFLDILSYLSPGCSYSKYLAAFGVTEKKGYWPYEYITNVKQLQETELPTHSAFQSNLKNKNISESEYRECQRVWKEKGMKNLGDLLMYYNNLDVQPFLSAIVEQTKFYADRGIDMLKDGIGVPGLTLRYLFKTMPSKDVYFSLFSENQADLHSLLRSQLVGGPSIIFHRYHEKGVTKIRENEKQEGKNVESLEGFDANALYLWAIMQNMPTGTPVVRRKTDNFTPRKCGRYGLLAREWLEWVGHQNGTKIKHKFNEGEQRLGKRNLPVDGWDQKSKTAYQFHGCVFHGCDKCKAGQKPFPHPFKPDVPREELFEKTREISEYLRESVDVTVVEMWECEWRKQKKRDRRINTFLKSRNLSSSYKSPFDKQQKQSSIKDQDIVNAIKSDKLFGLVQCDVEVPSGLKNYFSEMQPVFKNTSISKEDIGPFMKEYANEQKILSQPRRSLVGSYFGKQLLFATPLLKWYLTHGLHVSNVTLTIEYEPSPCFRNFGEKVSDARREGDRDPLKAIVAETMKLLGNSSYGKTITNNTNHCDVKFVNDADDQKLRNSPLFKKSTPLGPDWNEVESKKEVLNHKLPLHIGYFVYQYAKLRMLQFHFDLIDKYIDRADYQLCEMDTDSYYAVLSKPNLEDAIRPELRREFFEEYHHWFPSPSCDDHRQAFVKCRTANKIWVPSDPCCRKRQAFDKRTPGLFKLEYKGDGIVALCSKTYCCFGTCITDEETFRRRYPNDDKVGVLCTKELCFFGKGCKTKTSAKGINKNLNYLARQKYLNVLLHRMSGSGLNRGFRSNGCDMHTYSQTRDALSFLYIKRVVAKDGITTSPLAI